MVKYFFFFWKWRMAKLKIFFLTCHLQYKEDPRKLWTRNVSTHRVRRKNVDFSESQWYGYKSYSFQDSLIGGFSPFHGQFPTQSGYVSSGWSISSAVTLCSAKTTATWSIENNVQALKRDHQRNHFDAPTTCFSSAKPSRTDATYAWAQPISYHTYHMHT